MPFSHKLTKKILFVVMEDFYFVGHRLPMARAARAAGYEVHVATRVGDFGEQIRSEGFVVHAMPFERGRLSPSALASSVRALRRLLIDLAPDLIHDVGLQSCALSALASIGIRVPHIFAMTGLGYSFTANTVRAWIIRSTVLRVLRPSLNRNNSVMLVQNPDDRAALASAGIDPASMFLIPGSGVDTDTIQPLPEPNGAITIGFAGRLLVDKGIRALVAAHRILRARNVAVNLLIAGNPDPANPASVSIEEAQGWNNEPGITWLGHIGDILSLWQRSHVAVLPSHREGLPLSLLEAAAAGRPMIATDAPGCREIVIHEQTGLLVPIEDPPALADAIQKLVESQELRRRYGAAARELVVNKMSAHSIGEAIVALYATVLERHRQR